MFHVNGISYGVAAENIPPTVYAVVDLYGKVTQVTVISSHDSEYIIYNIICYLIFWYDKIITTVILGVSQKK